jgi:hypothetical protein
MFSSRVQMVNMNISMKKYIYVYMSMYIHRLTELTKDRAC